MLDHLLYTGAVHSYSPPFLSSFADSAVRKNGANAAEPLERQRNTRGGLHSKDDSSS